MYEFKGKIMGLNQEKRNGKGILTIIKTKITWLFQNERQ